MMQLINHTPFAVEALPAMIGKDKTIISVIIKGTFDMQSDSRTTTVADQQSQLPVFFGDEFFDPENGGSVKFEADLAPFKPRADIVLVGHAYAPASKPVNGLKVGLRVGSLKQTLLVIGDRYWRNSGDAFPVISAPKPFTRLPLIYEHAFGGRDDKSGECCQNNPLGRGFIASDVKAAPDKMPLPNIERAEQPIRTWKDQPVPAGFGFCSKTWQPRAGYLGTYDEQWQQTRAPGPPIDFRSDYFNGAHPDWQLKDYLKGDELIDMANMTPESRLHAQLPGIQPVVQVNTSLKDEQGQVIDAAAKQVTALTLKLDTLCLLPDQRQLYLVWRGHCSSTALTAPEVDSIEVLMQ